MTDRRKSQRLIMHGGTNLWANQKSIDTMLNFDNYFYAFETECDGNEPLTDKVKRLIFSEKGAICL